MQAVETTPGRKWSAAIVALVIVLSGVAIVAIVTSRGSLPDYPPDLIFPPREVNVPHGRGRSDSSILRSLCLIG